MRKLYFLLLFLCSFVLVKAQVGGYVFSASSGTFTPISGGTSVATSTSAADFLGDTKTSTSIPIGFTFNYAGVNYTSVIAASDGFLSFNPTATSAATNNLSTTAAARRPLVAPLWDDLDGASGSGSAKYITTGSAGSRVFTIEWLNWQWQYDATGATISFQVKLYEGTNVVEFVYRRETGAVSFGSASIGLAGVGTGSGNFLSLNGSGTAPAASSTTETTTISAKPATGQVYTFTPPAPCTSPTAQPTALVLTPASTTIGGSFTAASPAADGYLVVRTTGAAPTSPVDGTTYTAGSSALGGTIVQAGAGTTFSATSLTANTSYAFYVFAMNFNCSGGPKYMAASPINATAATCPAAPGSVTTSAVTTNSFTLNWAAPAGGTAAPIASYTVEVSTNSAFTAPVTGSPFTAGASDVSLNITGLNHSTLYYYRVRANTGCNGAFATGNVSTTCQALNVPYSENFDAVTAPTVPACYTINNVTADAYKWETSTTAPASGTNSMYVRYNSTAAMNDWFFLPGLNLTGGTSYRLVYKYRSTSSFTEKLKVMYGTAATPASMTVTLADYTSLASSTYATATIDFTPASTGVYYIGFQGYSAANQNYILVDDISVTLSPSCVAPSAVSAGSITTSGASISFTSTGSNFILEYGAPGFTPGTGLTAGTGGTVVTGTASPIALTGLAANTSFDVYIRQNCGVDGLSANSAKMTFTTACGPATIPYTMPISAVTTPALPQCVTVADVNGDASTWKTYGSTFGVPGFTYPVIAYLYNSTNAANDWLFTQGLNLTAGRTYKLSFKYNNDGSIPADGPDYYPEKLKVMYGTSNTAAGMISLLADYPTVASVDPRTAVIEFTPSSSGVYYVGFQAYSAADQDALVLDDISVTVVPILDVTPTAFIAPALNCATNQVTLKATIKNTTTVALDLAANPVTVTAAITGAGTGNLTGTVNSGTLAPGASMDVTLTPNFDFNASGIYNIAVTTSMTGDEDVANNSLSATVNIAPPPPVPVITPAAPVACAGVPQQLTAASAFAALSGTIGTGTTLTTGNVTTSALGPNPFQNYYGGAKQQMLFTAAELAALGMVPGTTITAIRFDLGAADNTYALDNFSVKMGHSNAATLTTWESSLTTVRSAASLTPQAGVNTITLSTPFVWNGTASLVIETSYSNNNGGTSGTTFNTAKYSTTTGQTTLFYRVDNTTAATLAAYTGTPSYSYTSRNNTGFDFSGTTTITWSPATGLYTDAAATVPYTGGAATTVYAKINAPATYTVTSTSGVGCTSTATVNVGVTAGPAITGHPSNQAVCAGGTASFSVTATGPSITYQWKKDGNDIPGANSSTLTINSVAAADAGSYTVVIGSTCSSITSNAATLSLAAAPAITAQPQAQTGCTGSNVSFSVTATGDGLTYQWRRNGSDIPGANAATYTINGITSASAGSYDVVVSGTCSPSVTSTAVSLTVDAAPIINTQPQAQTVCAGANATFTVGASGSGLTYQWRRNGSDISGANSSTYTITGVTAANAGNYDVVVSTSCNTTVTSAIAALAVNAPPAIGTQPQNQAVCAGGTATFSVSATGTGLAYQWRINGNDIPGANSSTLTINNVTAANAGNYTVVVSGTCTPSVTSGTATLSLTAAPAISTQPQAQTGCVGANVSFSVTATGAGLTYQWRKGGTDITGANSATYTINGVTAASAGSYDVVVSGTCSPSVTSNAVSLTVNATPIITTQPQAQTVCAGANASFTVAATGSGLTYQWRRNGTDISGATAPTYTITGATAASAGNYDVVITTSCNTTITSNTAALAVNAAPAITTQPQHRGVCLGNTATFSVSATGTGLTYQWRINGNDIPGANSSTLIINNVTAANTGNYTVVVSGTCAPSVTSNVAILSIDATNTWLGTVDNNWNNAANWCGGVPTTTTDVVISAGAPFAPSISAAANARDVMLGNGSTLTITAAGNLNIYGNLLNNGTLTIPGTISFRGASAQSVPAITAANVVMNGTGGVNLGGVMTITSALTLTNGNITLGNNNLVLNAGATGSTASHIITNGSGAVVANSVTTAATVPVGPTAASYNPVTIANGQGRNYTVSVATGLNPALFNNAKAINRTWTVTPNIAPAGPVIVSLQYADADANASAVPSASMEMGVHTGTGWVVVTPVGGTAPTGSAGARVVSVPVSQFGAMVLANTDGISSSTLPDITRSVLMPNLVQNTTVLRVTASRATAVSWKITDASGHVVMEFSKQLLPGQNDITLFLGHLANGMYYLNGFTSGDALPVLRFIRK
jgi:hypothetical protein